MDSKDPQKHQKPIELLVCNTCRKGLELRDGERRPGEILFDALTAVDLPKLVQIHGVNCISNCSQAVQLCCAAKPVELCLWQSGP